MLTALACILGTLLAAIIAFRWIETVARAARDARLERILAEAQVDTFDHDMRNIAEGSEADHGERQ